MPSIAQTAQAEAQKSKFGARNFKPTENASEEVKRAEKAYVEGLKSGGAGAAKDKNPFSQEMILGKMEEWVKLLLATLKNQDPESPMDHKDMLTQFSQFSQTMGMLQIKNMIEDMKKVMGTTQVLEAARQLDKLATVEAPSFLHEEGGHDILAFDAPDGAMKASLMITDAAGVVVNIMDLDCKPGRNEVVWTGMNRDEEPCQKGAYDFYVVPLDKDNQMVKGPDGQPLEVKTYVKGMVQGAEMNPYGSHVVVQGKSYPIDSLRYIESLRNIQEAKSEEPKKEEKRNTYDQWW